MAEKTGIEWCDATFNIAWGCMKVSQGCAHCYAETLADTRLGNGVWGPPATTPRKTFGPKHWNEPLRWARRAVLAGPHRIRIFTSSMCDVFEDHPTIDAEREKLWPLIRATAFAADWLILTKRPERLAAHLPSDWDEGYANVWLGTSVESQEHIGRIDALLDVPARVRFLSAEPLLGRLVLDTDAIEGLDWCIVGGESGPDARPMELAWARSLRDQCLSGSPAFFLKQLGGHPNKRGGSEAVLDGRRWTEMPAALTL